jgi:hypothetical protein
VIGVVLASPIDEGLSMLNSNGDLVARYEQPDAASRCLGLSDVSFENRRITGVDLRSVPPGTTLIIETRNSCYRVVALGGSDDNALVQGGAFFREETRARVEGATAGRSPIKAGWICIGLRLEISVGCRRFVTSPVRSISVEACPPTESRLEREYENHESCRVQGERSH